MHFPRLRRGSWPRAGAIGAIVLVPVAALLTFVGLSLHHRAESGALRGAVNQAEVVAMLAVDAHFDAGDANGVPDGEDRDDLRRQVSHILRDGTILGLQVVGRDGTVELSLGRTPSRGWTLTQLRQVLKGGDAAASSTRIGNSDVLTVTIPQTGRGPSLRATQVTFPRGPIDRTVADATTRIIAGLALALALFAALLLAERRIILRRDRQLLHDPVTGLPNRRALEDELTHASERAAKTQGRLVVAVVALNELKTIREVFGQDFADRVLVEAYERLCAAVPGVAVTQLDGEELAGFAATATPIERLADQLSASLESLAPPVRIDGRVVVVHGCAGIAVAETTDSAQETLRNARLALTAARKLGNAAVCSYEPKMLEDLTSRLALERDFDRALVLGEFEVHYQPIVHVDNEHLASVEALVRWRHPERGLLTPDAFIELAEADGFIVPLGAWVVGEACRQLQDWRVTHPQLDGLSVHVNISPRQLHGHDFVTHIRGVFTETGLPPDHLTLEVTESAIADAQAVQQLHDLRSLGVRIAVDDFGTGYSSLSYFDRFPVDSIKIDKRFVDEIDTRMERMTLAGLITRLAHQFGLRTVAEGVERVEQLNSLRALGCTEAQGYLFAKAAPPDQIIAILLTRTGDDPTVAETVASGDATSVALAIGPVPAEQARSWVAYARQVLGDLDDALDASPGALAVVAYYLDAWEHAALETDTFAWDGIEDPAIVWTVLRTWYAIAAARTRVADHFGTSVAPADAAAFEETLLGALMRALAAHDLDAHTTDHPIVALERSWPTSTAETV